MDADKLSAAVNLEYSTAIEKYKPMASLHEGYAILLEEVEELWDEIKKKPKKRNEEKLRKEAIQVAAMALRFLADLC